MQAVQGAAMQVSEQKNLQPQRGCIIRGMARLHQLLIVSLHVQVNGRVRESGED